MSMDNQGILVFNSGSSSIKFSLFAGIDRGNPERIFRGKIEGLNNVPNFAVKDADGRLLDQKNWEAQKRPSFDKLLGHVLSWMADHNQTLGLRAVGHRVVHGGPDYSAPVLMTPAILEDLARFNPLSPLHQPHNLAAIRTIGRLNPDLAQVACFDTAFHTTIPQIAQRFALPRPLHEAGIRRYGFHGLSYEYISGRLWQYDTRGAEGRTIVAHLGNGASMCALYKGQSVATSMGFSALEGLPMGTRTGSLDPGVILYLLGEQKMGLAQLETLLYKKSGLLGVSGISNDMRVLLSSDDARAEEAVSMFVYRIRREMGALTAVLGGLDTLVFTAGIGENAAAIRARVCEISNWPSVQLDPSANKTHGPLISSASSPVTAWVIPTNEELMIAQHTDALVSAQS